MEQQKALAFHDVILGGDKFAVVALDVKTEGGIPTGELAQGLWLLEGAAFPIPEHWSKWLGSIRMEELAGADIFLLSKLRSARPDVLDDENGKLKQTVWHFYVGLLLASRFAPAHAPVLLTGAHNGQDLSVRQQQDIDAPQPCTFRYYPPVMGNEFSLAARLGSAIEAITNHDITGGHWRLFQALTIYVEARSKIRPLDRIHQYSRVIEGLIAPDQGETKRQFKSRTELFVGPKLHKEFGRIYDIRSDVEHLHEERRLVPFDRAARVELVKSEAIIEYVARSALQRIILTPALWPHFANLTALEAFWGLQTSERAALWGPPIEALAALSDFDAVLMSDAELGAE
jgi:hypothetical protein